MPWAGDVLFWQKCIGALDKFMVDKEESSLEIVIFLLVKVRDSFLRIRKRMGLTLNLEATKVSALVIIGSEVQAQPLGGELPPRKGRGRVLTHQARPKKFHQI